MQGIDTTAASSAEGVVGPVPKAGTLLGGRAQARRQWLVTSTLVFSDTLLALLIWYVAAILHGVSGRGKLSEIALTSTVSNVVVVWVGLRALLGLYPGYGLGQAEELRLQTYALASTLAIASVFALTFQVGDLLSRLLLGLGFLSLLFLAPLLRHFASCKLIGDRSHAVLPCFVSHPTAQRNTLYG